MREYLLSTSEREQLISLDRYLYDAIRSSQVQEGIAVLYCPHTTAGLTINENADEDVVRDLLTGLNYISPDRSEYRHLEGNSSAHIKASLVGSSVTVIIHKGKPVFGTWQSVFFCEFDGPRARKVYIQVIGE